MTDEEMAEKYAKGNMHYEIAKRENGADYAKEVSSVTISQAFLAGLKQENAELKEQIEKMKCCENYCHYSHTYEHCYSYPSYQNCKSLSNWRLAE